MLGWRSKVLDVRYWVFKRKGGAQFIFAWAPDPEDPKRRKQLLLPKDLRTKPQAEEYARNHLAELTATKPPKRRRSAGPTVAELAPRWIAYREADERLASSTVMDNASHMKKWILPALGEKHVLGLDVPTLRKFVRELRREKAAYTCRNVLSTLCCFLNEIVAENWVKMNANPAEHKAVRAELPEGRPRAGRSQKLRLKAETAQALISADPEKVPAWRRVKYAVDLTGGYRDGEIAGLTWVRVDLDGKPPRADIEEALQLKSRDGWAKMGKTKTTGSVRTVPLHPCAVAALKWWKETGWEEWVGRKPKAGDHVFPNADGAPWRPKSAAHLRADLKAVGAETHVAGHALTFHALRRTFPSMLADAGVPKDIRDRLMGHAGDGAGERHYTEADMRVMAEYVGRIPLEWR